MLGPKIRLSRALYKELEQAAKAQDYSSVQEFAIHALEKAVSGVKENISEEEVKKRLQGLGYLG